MPRFEATGLVYAWPAKVSLDRLRAQGAWVLIERGRDGGLTLLSLLAPASPPAPSGARGGAVPGAAAAGLAPELSVREALVEGAGASDRRQRREPGHSRMEITGARLVVRDLAWPARGAATLELLVPTPGGGKVEASGQIRLDATRVDVTLALQQADLAVAQPYLPLRGRVGGKMDGQLAIKGSLTPLAVSATGSVIVADGLLADGQRTLADGQAARAGRPQRGLAAPRLGRAHRRPAALDAGGAQCRRQHPAPVRPGATRLAGIGVDGPARIPAHRESEARHRDRRGGRPGWLRPLRRQHDAAALRRGAVRAGVDGAPAGDGAPTRGARSRWAAG